VTTHSNRRLPASYLTGRVTAAFCCALLLIFSGLTARGEGFTLGSGSVAVILRDSRNGKRIPNAGVIATSSNGASSIAASDTAGRAAAPASGRTDIEVTAEGYKPIRTYFIIDGNELQATIYLDPLDSGDPLEARSIEDSSGERSTVFTGYVYDENGAPIRNATVQLDESDSSAVTDRDGCFELSISTPPINPVGDKPGVGNLRIEKDGRLVYLRENVEIPPGRSQLIIDTTLDGPAVVTDAKHKLSMDEDVLASSQSWGVKAEEPVELFARPDAVQVPSMMK
jgi:hypothetical protein